MPSEISVNERLFFSQKLANSQLLAWVGGGME